MDKAEAVFQKLSQMRAPRDNKDIDDDWLTEDLKNTIAGGAGALTGTTATFPLDTRATAAQSKSYNEANVKTKDFIDAIRGKGEGAKNQKELFEASRMDKVKDVGKKLLRKNFSGLGPKLMKTIPAMGITFGTIGATKRLLDEADKVN